MPMLNTKIDVIYFLPASSEQCEASGVTIMTAGVKAGWRDVTVVRALIPSTYDERGADRDDPNRMLFYLVA